jgi:hypothetical protein
LKTSLKNEIGGAAMRSHGLRATVLGIVAILLLGSAIKFVIYPDLHSIPKGPSATISLPDKKVALAVALSAPASWSSFATPVSSTFQIIPSGPLQNPALVKIPLLHQEPASDGLTIIMTTDNPSRGWTPLATTVIDGGRWAEATVTHLSWFTAVRISLSSALDSLKSFFKDFTADTFTHAQAPSCSNKAQAYAGYFHVVDQGNGLLWCLGIQNGQRVLKVVDARRYPLEISHTMPIVGGSSSTDLYQFPTRWLSPGLAIVFPFLEEDFGADIPDGRYSKIITDFSGSSVAFDALEVSAQAFLSIVTHFGASDDPTATMKVVDKLLTANSCFQAVRSGSIGAVLSGCLSPYQILKDFGVYGVLLAPLAAASGLIDFLHSSLNGIFDVIDNRTVTAITVQHPAAPGGVFLGQWVASGMAGCVGTTLNLTGLNETSNQNPPCASSGLAPVGWISTGTSCGGTNQVCTEYFEFTYTVNSQGQLVGTISAQPIYTSYDANGNIVVVHPGSPSPLLVKGSVFTLKHIAQGFLQISYAPIGNGNNGSEGVASYWCNTTVSQTNGINCGT